MVNRVGSLAAVLSGLIELNDDLALLVAMITIEQKASNLVLGLGSGLVSDSVSQDECQEYL